MKPKILDLFCGAGGAGMGYHRAGFDVVGVDITPQPNYPFRFVLADALVYLEWGDLQAQGFVAVHASPPCQRWSAKTRNRDNHPDLIDPIRPYLIDSGLPYVIENVVGAPLIDPITLCGTMFGLGVKRHRWFESNIDISHDYFCRHYSGEKKYRVYDHGKWYMSRFVPVYGEGGGKAKEHWAEAMGIDWMTHPEMAEAIPPAYTNFIGAKVMEAVGVHA